MKLSVAIKNNRFHFKYKVGVDEMTGHMNLCSSLLALFTEMVRQCQFSGDRSANKKIQKLTDKVFAENFVKENPGQVKIWLGKYAQKAA